MRRLLIAGLLHLGKALMTDAERADFALMTYEALVRSGRAREVIEIEKRAQE